MPLLLEPTNSFEKEARKFLESSKSSKTELTNSGSIRKDNVKIQVEKGKNILIDFYHNITSRISNCSNYW